MSESYRPNLNIKITCPDCKTYPAELIERYSDGDIVCGNCGFVLSERLVDTGSEWRTFNNDESNSGEDPNRVGNASNSLLDEENLSTLISKYPTSSGGRASKVSKDLNRISRKSNKTEHLQKAFDRISTLSEGYQLQKQVVDGAKDIYRIVRQDVRLKSKSDDAVIAASILLSTRKFMVARSFSEIEALTRVPKSEISKAARIIQSVMFEKDESYFGLDSNVQVEVLSGNPEDYVRRLCSNLGLSFEIANRSVVVAKKIRELGTLEGRSPVTVAAAIVYFVVTEFKDGTTLKDISLSASVSEKTVSVLLNKIVQVKDKLVDEEWAAHSDSSAE